MTSYTITIDEDVPVADKRPGDNSRYQHPLSWLLTTLNPGDSFIYPASTGEDFNGLRSIAHSIGRRTGKKFATRTVKDREGVSRLRFWRTK
jgi:hypothetical protein